MFENQSELEASQRYLVTHAIQWAIVFKRQKPKDKAEDIAQKVANHMAKEIYDEVERAIVHRSVINFLGCTKIKVEKKVKVKVIKKAVAKKPTAKKVKKAA